MRKLAFLLPLLGALAACLASCNSRSGDEEESAEAFVQRVNTEMLDLAKEGSAAGWVQNTYITPDTQMLNAKANERYLAYFSEAVETSKRFDEQLLDPATARALALLKLGVAAPAPNEPDQRAELTTIASRMEALYGEGKYCPAGPESCRNLEELSETLAKSRDYDELTEAWTGWRTISRPMRADYRRFVELANAGARELGYQDLGVMWRSGYDMAPEEFEAETERLWMQVKPLYDQLHAYVRARLAERYGRQRVAPDKPIPAQLLGNMWAQSWGKIYDLLEPYPGEASLDVDRGLRSQQYDAPRMMRSAEEFYTSIGFPALPDSFWRRSMLTRPRDREVVCHASAWHMDGDEDVRIKMCIQPTEEELTTIYHELGHIYYYLWYKDLPFLFQGGAHDGFHEAVGDTIVLSMTPGYLSRIGLIGEVQPGERALINQQMRMALEKIAFLPFGKMIDQWRWQVFSGQIKPTEYNQAWWALRTQYQGIAPPVQRTEADFDPGAKYHIPGNTPYTRYFLSFILQFQFHKALCEAAQETGPLHECSIYGSEAAGQRFGAMLAQGASAPWQDTLEKLAGVRRMDAGAIIEYFAPLMAWLQEQNQGVPHGW